MFSLVAALATTAEAQYDPLTLPLPEVTPHGRFAFSVEGFGSIELIAIVKRNSKKELEMWLPDGTRHEDKVISTALQPLTQSVQTPGERYFVFRQQPVEMFSQTESRARLVNIFLDDPLYPEDGNSMSLSRIKLGDPLPYGQVMSIVRRTPRLPGTKRSLRFLFNTNVPEIIAYTDRQGLSWSPNGTNKFAVRTIVVENQDGERSDAATINNYPGLMFRVVADGQLKANTKVSVLLRDGTSRAASPYPSRLLPDLTLDERLYVAHGVKSEEVAGFELTRPRALTVVFRDIATDPEVQE